MKVLVAYASKHESTSEIAAQIAEQIGSSGLEVHMMSAGAVVDPAKYDAFVIGSAVYAGQWMSTAADLLITYEKLFTTCPTWLFSSGPTGEGDPVALLDGFVFPMVLEDIAKRINPEDIKLFHGKIDMGTLSWGERLIIKAVRGQTGDFRDWDDVHAWAQSIRDTLLKKNTPVSS